VLPSVLAERAGFEPAEGC